MVIVHNHLAEFRFFRPDAKQAFLVGDFNRWGAEPCPMARSAEHYWVARICLPPGTYRFRYVFDGESYSDYAAYGEELGTSGQEGVVRILTTGAKPVGTNGSLCHR